ncbi:TPA: hypothetical protein N0F65_010916 [Lagenidium giganteum]|uniref:Fibronectin type-III domain-containing protein n=1 Tax=Lagenidium giganteum TaxID=4803 RepID=A0AAV2YY04_9STRA|nr:TPA: hypothetical protein N0F65_010916 [Lagenidium giganteum]
MAPYRPPPAHLKARSDFSVTMHVPKPPSTVAGPTRYRFEFKPAGPDTKWSEAKTVETQVGDDEVLLDDLNPTSSYEIRLYALTQVTESERTTEVVSEPSEVAAVDTDVPGCTPQPSCVIL